jgi:hypothetical protein
VQASSDIDTAQAVSQTNDSQTPARAGPISTPGRRRLPENRVEMSACPTTSKPPFPVGQRVKAIPQDESRVEVRGQRGVVNDSGLDHDSTHGGFCAYLGRTPSGPSVHPRR